MPEIEAKKSERQVAVSMDGFPVKYLGQLFGEIDIPLTEADAERLLQDKEFLEKLMDDVFTVAIAEVGDSDPADVLDLYSPVFDRLGVKYDRKAILGNDPDDDDDDDDDDDEDDSDLEGSDLEDDDTGTCP